MIDRVFAIWVLGVAAAAAQDATPVQVRELSTLLSPVIFTAPAEVVSANRSRLSARLDGQIQAVLVDVGDPVDSGQTLVVLDCADYELTRQRAEAALQSARAQFKRADQQLRRSESLARNTLISEDLIEQRQTAKDAADAELRRARIELAQAELSASRCRVDSPFEGVVTERLASQGELARPGTPLLEIVDLQSIELAAQVFPAEEGHLEASPRVYFRFLNESYPLRIDRHLPVIDPVTRNLEVRLKFENQRAPVGASGRLIWHGKEPGIPAGLLVRREERLGIFIARDGRAVFHLLSAALEGRPAMVDLPPQTLIVTAGRHALNDGDRLKIVD